MKTAITILILLNIPSLAFLAASLWCIDHGRTGFAVANIVLAAYFLYYPKDGGKE